MNYTFELKELQATHIVYLHHQGDISLIPSSIRKLMQWAGPKGLINGPANKLISVYQHEGKELSVEIAFSSISSRSIIWTGIHKSIIHLSCGC